MTTMLDPEVKPSPAREFVHKGKGCLAVIVAAAVLVVGGYLVYDRASAFLDGLKEPEDYTGTGKGAITITIPKGATSDDIGDILVHDGVVSSNSAWESAVRRETNASSIQAGRYKMRKQMPARLALGLLINPGESLVRLQFIIKEGLRLSDQVTALVTGTKIAKTSYQAALKKPKTLGLPEYAKNRPEGFLFPETYELTADATAASTLKQMVAQYNSVADDIDLEARAKKLKVKPYDVVVVASIIEKEVRRPQDRAKVARVLYNRLAKDRKLELDSTVVYAEKLKTNTTTPKDRDSKSPYNTYRYEGLPPGPISAPGKAALQAAANPASGKWLYFVTVNFDSGETEFGVTEADFNRINAKFKKYCRDNKGKCDS